ncbi:MAG: ATP-binding cassette domain-containing protein [Eubacterium sp.]|nr:ATP-binding cassette domain-containing protein [Eubacterium sp.]
MIKTRLIKLLDRSIKYVVFQVICQWIMLLCQIVIVFNIAKTTEDVVNYNIIKSTLAERVFIILVAAFIRFIMDRMYVKASFRASADVKITIREKIYRKLLELGSDYRNHISSAEAVQLSTEGVEQLEVYFGKYLSQFAYSLLAPITLFVALLWVDFICAGVLLVMVPLIPVTIVIVMKIGKKLLKKYWGRYAGLSDSFLESLNGLTTLKIYGADERRAEELKEESNVFRKITMKVLSMQLNSTIVMDILAYGGAAVGMVIALSHFAAGDNSISDVMMIVLLSAEFFLPMRVLGSYFHVAMNGMSACDRMFELLDIGEETEESSEYDDDDYEIEAEDNTEETAQNDIKEIAGNDIEREDDRILGGEGTEKTKFAPIDIEIRNLSYIYPDGRKAIQEADMDFKNSSLTAIAGLSGSGKSTIAGVLSGMNKDYTGSVRLNGEELNEITEDSKPQVILVSGKSYLFTGSVRDNLRIADPTADDNKLVQILKRVKMMDVLETKGGLDAFVSDGADNLSGGQRQRIAFARAVLADAQVYIFDEATSNIDIESERVLLREIRELAKTKTVILISHRLSNLVECDKIYYLKDGYIRGCDNHIGLLKENDEYKGLFQQQQKLENYIRPNNVRIKKYITNDALKQLKEDRHSDYNEDFDTEQEDINLHRRPALIIMGKMIRLIRPLIPIMFFAIILGSVGHLLAISLTVLAGADLFAGFFTKNFYYSLLLIAVLRGVLHYGEQFCNHYIAFKILASIRNKVFEKMRSLAPAKLDGRGKGNLVTLLTSDIEKLEVFYAHTVSPIMIGIIVSATMIVFMFKRSAFAALVGLLGYYLVGVIVPIIIGKLGRKSGMKAGETFGKLNNTVLESLYGLDEIIQFGDGENRLRIIKSESEKLMNAQADQKKLETYQRAFTNLIILLTGTAVMMIAAWQVGYGAILGLDYIILVTSILSSFGPMVALSNLSNNLISTLASGERVLRILEEQPKVSEVAESEADSQEPGEEISGNIKFDDVAFSYGDTFVLKDITFSIPEKKMVAIHGESGAGKSTILKLIMRFWDSQYGSVSIGNNDVRQISSNRLRSLEGYVTQDTWLFHDTIKNNIKVGKNDASDEEIKVAAKKAAIHDFIMSLEKGYDTEVGELGNTLSEGEKQRLGLARAFLHDSPIMLLDEPTSNLDALNEGIILKSLEHTEDKTVILVSHRDSTINVADVVYEMQ